MHFRISGVGSQGLVLLCLVLSAVDGVADFIVGLESSRMFMATPFPPGQAEGGTMCF